MASTISISINNVGWTAVDGGFTAGFLSLGGGGSILYRQSTGSPFPSVTDGHVLNPPSDSINFNLPSGDNVWARSENATALVFVTQTVIA